jgi:hypothetical protein
MGSILLVNPGLLAQWLKRPSEDNFIGPLPIVTFAEDGTPRHTVYDVHARGDGYSLQSSGHEVCRVNEEWICSRCKTRRCERSRCRRAALLEHWRRLPFEADK